MGTSWPTCARRLTQTGFPPFRAQSQRTGKELQRVYRARLRCFVQRDGGHSLAVKLLGVGHGDEVVTPTLTFAASCNPILYQGGIPIFIDSDRASWNLNRDRLADFLHGQGSNRQATEGGRGRSSVRADSRPRLNSRCMCSVWTTCARGCCRVSWCTVQRPYSRGRGRCGCLSFNGNKIITGTSGGILVSARKEWVERDWFWSTQPRDGDPLGVNNYVHSELGYNYRMSNVLAGIAPGQLEVLDLRVQQVRRAVFDRYRAAFADLPGIEPQPEAEFGDRRSEIGDGWEGQGAGGGVGCEEWGVRGEGQVAKGKGRERSTFNVQRSTFNHQPSTINHQPACP